ncbi:MAG TPA: hypothetical protein VKV73_04320 [Chloroflexota bacterium]|nr:hypothetical protein [Chloroflexota bacterium]
MFQFLMGVAFGAAGYWAWQSFGRDLVGMGSDQETTYGGFSGGSTSSNYGSTSTGSGATSDPTTSASSPGGATGPTGSTA